MDKRTTMAMHTKRQIMQVTVAWTALIVFMMALRPQHLPVLLLVAPFVLLFIALSSLWALLAPAGHWLLGQREYKHSKRPRYTVCGSIVLCLILQSLGQLTIRDLLTIAAIVGIGSIYIGRSRSTTNQAS